MTGRARAAILASFAVAGCGLSVVGVEPESLAPGDAGPAPSIRPPTRDVAAPIDDVDAETDPAVEDAGLDARPPRALEIVQKAKATANNETTLSLGVEPTKAGSFIALIASVFQENTSRVSGIADNAAPGTNVYVSANARSTASNCQGTEIWYARATRSTTKITVTLTATGTIQLWMLEVSGLSASGIAEHTSTRSGIGTTTSSPDIPVASVPALVLAGVASCGNLGDPQAQNPFVSLDEQDGNSAGYFLPTAAGTSTNVSWSNPPSLGWNQSVAVFR